MGMELLARPIDQFRTAAFILIIRGCTRSASKHLEGIDIVLASL